MKKKQNGDVKIEVIEEREKKTDHQIKHNLSSLSFLQGPLCNIATAILVSSPTPKQQYCTHTDTHRGFKGLNSCTFDLLKNEWAWEMRWKAKGEGSEGRCQKEEVSTNVLATEMEKEKQMLTVKKSLLDKKIKYL